MEQKTLIRPVTLLTNILNSAIELRELAVALSRSDCAATKSDCFRASECWRCLQKPHLSWHSNDPFPPSGRGRIVRGAFENSRGLSFVGSFRTIGHETIPDGA